MDRFEIDADCGPETWSGRHWSERIGLERRISASVSIVLSPFTKYLCSDSERHVMASGGGRGYVFGCAYGVRIAALLL